MKLKKFLIGLILTFLSLLALAFSVSAATVYVNGTHASCSNSYSRTQATNPNTPYCSLSQSLAAGNVSSGDVVLVVGIFNDTDTFNWGSNQAFASETYWIMVDGSFGKSKVQGFNIDLSITGDSDWTFYGNYTGSGGVSDFTLWKTTSYGATSSTVMSCAYSNGSGILRAEAQFEIMNVSRHYVTPSYFFNGTGDDAIILRLPRSDNPNNIAFKCAARGLIDFSSAQNVTLINFYADGGTEIYTITGAATHGIKIINSTGVNGKSDKGMFTIQSSGDNHQLIGVNGSGNKPVYGTWTDQKNTGNDGNEYSCVWAQNPGDNFVLSNFTCTEFFNGVYIEGTTAANAPVSSNLNNGLIYDVYDDCLELENYAEGWLVKNVTTRTCYIGLSISPLNSSPSRTHIIDSIFSSDRQIIETQTVNTSGVSVKAYNNFSEVNLNMSHNTFYGRECWNSRISSTNVMWGAYEDSLFLDNICYSITGNNPIQVSGLESDGNFWDYNLYYQEGSSNIATFFNGGSSTALTLAGMQAALGTWNINSYSEDPLFVDAANGNFKPNTTNACYGSSTGSYIGAVACVAESPPAVQTDILILAFYG